MGKYEAEIAASSLEESSSRAATLALAEIVSTLIATFTESPNASVDLNILFKQTAKKYKLSHPPRLAAVLAAVPPSSRALLLPRLRARPVRSASGVAVVAVMSAPHRCPHIATTGNVCVYCPGGPDSDFEYSTQSYTGYEPTSMRAIRARYDPYVQAKRRMEQLRRLGHAIDKVEYILMGGTFMSLSKEYKEEFVSALHDACSGASSHGDVRSAVRSSEASLGSRCIGLTIETRPDYCQPAHLEEMLGYGCTRLELGVQSTYEDVARDTNRGHTVAAVRRCFCLAKEKGFKVVAHMMPDLPNVGMERDVESFTEFFESPGFRCDGMKLYPTLVIRGTGLYELWRTGQYRNYEPHRLVDLIARVLALVPPWTRVYRIQRDIPMPLVTSGVERGNLRELALARMAELGLKCRDVRTREVGIQALHRGETELSPELVRRDYVANGGWETFLAYEDARQDVLVGLLRLRRVRPQPKEKGGRRSIVRELHVYGSALEVRGRGRTGSRSQHRGYGTLLMREAERIATYEHGSEAMDVISGVGTRHYYRMLGYELNGHYMSKTLVAQYDKARSRHLPMQ